jgi:hypothetical protein
MKQLFIAFAFILFADYALAQTTVYDPNVELRSIKDYKAIEVSGGIDLFVSYGEENVAVSASEERYREHIKTEVKNGVLKIWYDENGRFSVSGKRNLKAYVSYKTLVGISASGGSDVLVDGTLKNKEFIIDISGGSDFKGQIDVTALTVHQSGGSDISISGKANKVNISASGGSDFSGYNLTADYGQVEASGGSDVEITVNKELSARASGASDITYKGTAEVKESKSSGASSVTKRS